MNADTTRYVNEVIRPTADRVAGLMLLPKEVIDVFLAKDLAADLGFAESLVTREEPLELADYGAITPAIIQSGDDRTAISNIEVLAFLRIIRFLGAALDADPAAKQLVRKIAVNPRVS
jgi:hypothetical protein